MTVHSILELLASGMTLEEVVAYYADLERAGGVPGLVSVMLRFMCSHWSAGLRMPDAEIAERATEIPATGHLHLDEPARWVGAVDTFGTLVL